MVGCSSDQGHVVHDPAPVPVKVSVAQSREATQAIRVSGRIEASKSANISTRMMGNITSLKVRVGQKVNQGQLLLVIANADLSAKKAQVAAAILQAKSNYENAEKDFQRFSILREKGSASQKELENMTTRYEMAQASLASAQEMEKEVEAQFAYTHLRAPFSGVVTSTFVKVGDIANPGMPLLSVEGTSEYEAVVLVPESRISHIQPGAPATVKVKSSALSFQGRVKELSPSAQHTGGQFLVKIQLKEPKNVFPGMFVNANISVNETLTASTSPMIAKSALIRKGQLTGLYALGADNTAILRWVRTGKESGELVEVLSGISDGERYILKPEGKLFNGAKVLRNN